MANAFSGLGNVISRVSFNYENIFKTIESRSDKIADAIINLFGYIENEHDNQNINSGLSVIPIHQIWDSEDAMIRELSGNKIHFGDKKDLIAIYHPLRFKDMDMYLRVFYFPNNTITNHVHVLTIDECNHDKTYSDYDKHHFISVFIDNTIYDKKDNDHFTEKYAIYIILKSYIHTCFKIVNAPQRIIRANNRDLVAWTYAYKFYKTLGNMYRVIVPGIEKEFIETLFPDNEEDTPGVVYIDSNKEFNTMLNHIIHNGFNGEDFDYDTFFNTPIVHYV